MDIFETIGWYSIYAVGGILGLIILIAVLIVIGLALWFAWDIIKSWLSVSNKDKLRYLFDANILVICIPSLWYGFIFASTLGTLSLGLYPDQSIFDDPERVAIVMHYVGIFACITIYWILSSLIINVIKWHYGISRLMDENS